jgi:hypothetical protein
MSRPSPAQRKRYLLALYRRVGGDLDKSVVADDVDPDASGKDTGPVIRQLEGLGLLRLAENQVGPHKTVYLTMKGVQEAERMEASWYRRFAQEYPFLNQACWSVLTLLAGTVLLWLFGFKR